MQMSNQQYTQMDIYFDNFSPGREKVGEKEKGRDWERQRDGKETKERQSDRKRREMRRGK